MKFGWFADSHLGVTQYGLARRRDDFSDAFIGAVMDMIENHGIKYILHSGDMLDSTRPDPDTMQKLRDLNAFMTLHGVTLFFISGNHDNSDPHWASVVNERTSNLGFQLIDKKIITIKRPGDVELTIHGVPNMPRAAFLDYMSEAKAAHILLMHQAVTQFIGFPDPGAVDMFEIPRIFRAVLIGDIHKRQIMTNVQDASGNPWFDIIGYPGSTEQKYSNEDPDKTWVELEFDTRGNYINHALHPIATRPVIYVTIDTKEDLDSAVETIRKFEEENHDRPEPIIYGAYKSDVPEVMERLRKNFDPSRFIFRLKPVFAGSEIKFAKVDDKNLDMDEIIKTKLKNKPGLTEVTSALLNPEGDAGAILDRFIETRLQTIEAELAEESGAVVS